MQSRLTIFTLALFLIAAQAGATSICSITTTSTGWTWTCPQIVGASVCKDMSEDGIDYSSGHSVSSATLTSKYGGVGAAYAAIDTRMKNEGITSAGQYSYTYASNYPTNGIPYEPTEDMGLYLQQSRFSWTMKNQAYVINPNAMTCNSTGSFFEGETPDDFDPAAATNYTAIWAVNAPSNPESIYNSYPSGQVRDFIPDDGDSLYAYDSITTHPDSAYIIAANNPVQATGNATYTGGTVHYANATAWVKVGMADYLGGEYGCTASGTSITGLSESGYIATATVANSFTAGEMVIISGATPSGYNNGGYPVLVMPENLSSSSFQYVLPTASLGSGSGASVSVVESPLVTSGTDPIGLTSCGSTKIANSLSALNTAWGTSYTTWGTSDAHGLAGIATGGGNAVCTASNTPYSCCTGNGTGTCNAYASYGTGTGLLDEKGNHISSSTFQSGCGGTPPSYTTSWGNTTAVTNDLRQFVGIDGALHALLHRVGYAAVCGGTCPPLGDLYYDSPNEVYQQASPYLDILVISPSYYTTLAAAKTRVQTIVNDDGDTPIRLHDYAGIPATSGCSTSTQAFLCKTTESAAGAAEEAFYAGTIRDKNPLGFYPIIGFGHWMGYDWNNSSSSGIYSINDNMYDGSNASTLTTCTASWAANHTYTLPACISDGTTNCSGGACKQMLAIAGEAGATCISGPSSAPTWASGYGAFTYGDGTCIWNNGSTYTQIAESANAGNWLNPLVGFLTNQDGSICDPSNSNSLSTALTIGKNEYGKPLSIKPTALSRNSANKGDYLRPLVLFLTGKRGSLCDPKVVESKG